MRKAKQQGHLARQKGERGDSSRHGTGELRPHRRGTQGGGRNATARTERQKQEPKPEPEQRAPRPRQTPNPRTQTPNQKTQPGTEPRSTSPKHAHPERAKRKRTRFTFRQRKPGHRQHARARRRQSKRNGRTHRRSGSTQRATRRHAQREHRFAVTRVRQFEAAHQAGEPGRAPTGREGTRRAAAKPDLGLGQENSRDAKGEQGQKRYVKSLHHTRPPVAGREKPLTP